MENTPTYEQLETNRVINTNSPKKSKSKSKSKSVSYFKIQYHFTGKKELIIVFFATLGALAAGLSLPIFSILFGDALDNLGTMPPEKLISTIADLSIKFVYVGAAIWVASFLFVFLFTLNGKIIAQNFKEKYFHLIMRQEQSYFDEINSFEFATKVQQETKILEKGIGQRVGNALMSLSMFISSFVVSFIISWKLTLVLLPLIPLMMLGGWYETKCLQEGSAKNREAYEKAGGVAEETLYNIKTVASFVNFDYEKKRFSTLLEESYKAGVKNSFKLGLGNGYINFIVFGAYGLAVWFGSYMIFKREPADESFRAGDILTVLFTVIFGAFSLGQAAPNFTAISEACNSAYPYFALLKRNPRLDFSQSVQTPPKELLTGKITFKDVSFAYPTKQDKQILNNLNIVFQPGSQTAVVGESGSGKSTIINLIERLYDVDMGEVLIDDYNIKTLKLDYFRSLIGYVPQEPVLFNTTVRENIIFGRENVTDAEIEAACRKAYATEFLTIYGLDYVVGIKGSKLSGGQKQRIAIARAILTQPKFLILDEATSALDNRSEKEVQRALDHVSKEVTTIIIAHRLSTIRNSDTILFLDKGEIVEKGSHEDLIKLNGQYANLVRTQMGVDEQIEQEPLIVEDEVQDIRTRRDTLQTTYVDTNNVYKAIVDKTDPNELKKKKQIEKKQNAKKLNKAKRKLFPIIFERKDLVIGAMIFAALNGAIWPPYAILLADTISSLSKTDINQVKDDGVMLAIYFVILAVSSFATGLMQVYYFSYMGEYLTKRLRELTFIKYLRLHMGFFDRQENTPGALLTKLSSSTAKINGVALTMIGVSVQMASCLLIGLIIGFIYEWRLSLITISFIPLIIINAALEFKLQEGFAESDENIEVEAGSILSESVLNTKTIFSYNMQDKVVEMYNNILKTKEKNFVKSAAISGLIYGFGQFVMFATFATTFYAGAQFMVQDKLSLQYMLRALFVLVFCSFGVGQAQQYVGDYGKSKEALVEIFEILEEPSLIDPYAQNETTVMPASLRGKIQFRNVIFSYPTKQETTVLKNVSFDIDPGTKAAFVGYSGSGKSTIVQLLERFYDVNQGQILIDDIDLRSYDLIQYRKNVSMVMQEPVLFKTDIITNIKYGKLDATDTEIEEAMKKANITKFLDPSYDKTVLPVSGGEKQRVAIARSMIRNPNILLLDEATSALDRDNEAAIQANLDELMQGRTTICIAHKLATIQHFDKIFLMDKGQIVEQGSHEELLSKDGKYAALFRSGQK